MKHLYLVRHAKASTDYISYSDFERPLTPKGIEGAHQAATFLKSNGVLVDLIIASSALRTLQTAEIISPYLNIDLKNIIFDKEIYHAFSETLLELIMVQDDALNSLMLIGHNPAMTETAHILLGKSINHMKTSAVVALNIDILHWSDLLKPQILKDYFQWRCA